MPRRTIDAVNTDRKYLVNVWNSKSDKTFTKLFGADATLGEVVNFMTTFSTEKNLSTFTIEVHNIVE